MKDLYCSLSLPSKYVLGLKEYAKGRLKCHGWLLSPYKDVSVQIEIDGSEDLILDSFLPRKEVLEKFPEYKQEGRGFFFEAPVKEGSQFFKVSLYHKKEILLQETYFFDQLTKKIRSNGKRSKEFLIDLFGQKKIPNGNVKVPLFELTKSNYEKDLLSMCGYILSQERLEKLYFFQKSKNLKADLSFLEKKEKIFYRDQAYFLSSFEAKMKITEPFREKLSCQVFQKEGLMLDYGISKPLGKKILLYEAPKTIFKEKFFHEFLNQELIF